ncbi:5,6-dimethylbenzimidazole synthase [Flexibacterium corallicola]|uniref:5,6-dimethylbenzimidazole synthase n=1 Tax=Flexibacterium corallicola TaxID=3037259 RepID=UPI00286F6D8C|nr:5,6-dimethylbenzimidazole synthase [Pseudovibrio sp. M1P-2-3]
MNDKANREAPEFSEGFLKEFHELLEWRRDVRHFKTDALREGVLERLLALTDLSPSVGNSQPWRFILIEDPELRGAAYDNFQGANEQALKGYNGQRAALYAQLKLSGMQDAPVHLAVFCDEDPEQGRGLGRQTMPETLRYSVVSAINTLWLGARAEGVGLGWVSILEPEELKDVLKAPDHWSFVAYLCMGYPQEERSVPELQTRGWQSRTPWQTRVYKNKFSEDL